MPVLEHADRRIAPLDALPAWSSRRVLLRRSLTRNAHTDIGAPWKPLGYSRSRASAAQIRLARDPGNLLGRYGEPPREDRAAVPAGGPSVRLGGGASSRERLACTAADRRRY